MNSIDLSLAPKDATHYTKETKTTNACWVNINHSLSKYVTMSEVHHNKDSYIWQIGEFPSSELIELDINPVYSQAMADAGVMPSVGMEFISTEFGEPRHSIIKAITNEYIIYICADPKHLSECCIEICANHHKPLTPSIELIEGKAYQFINIEDNTIHGIYSEDEHSFQSLCVEWSAQTCTNIQLLEVK